MRFKEWLRVNETGTSVAAVSAPASGAVSSTDTSMIARVPTSLFGGRLAKRKFAKGVSSDEGLAGPLRTFKFNK